MEPLAKKPDETSGQSEDSTKIQVQVTAKPTTAPLVTETTLAAEPPEIKPTVDEVPVAPAAPDEPETPVSAVPTEPAAPLPKKSKKGLLLATGLLVAALGVGVWAYLRVNQLARPAVSTADEAKKDVSELRIGSSASLFNAFYPDPNYTSGGAFAVNLQLYEGLVGFENGEKLVPLLAESWTNPDDLTWVFKLKPNVKFHTGTVVTTEDVRRSIDDAVKNPRNLSLLISTIESVTATDATTVTIKTKEPDAILLNKLALLFVQSTEKVNGAPAGTGAYRVEDNTTVSDRELHLIAFDEHHLGRPAVRRVSYTGYDQPLDAVQAIKDGTVDMTDFLSTATDELSEIAGFNKQTHSFGQILLLGLNSVDTASPLNKLKVRQAIQLAVDQAAFLKQSGRTGQALNQLTVQSNVGYNPAIQAPARDVAKAKQLLTEAGYPRGLTLEFHFGETALNRKTFDILKAQVAEAGITLKDVPGANANEYFTRLDAGETQAYLLSLTSVFFDSYDLFAFNFRGPNFNNAELNTLLDRSNEEFNATTRKQTLQEASKLLVDQVAGVPLAQLLTTYYVRNNLNYQIDTPGFSAGGYVRTISAK